MFALSEFDIGYQPAKAVKGQALADLIAERTSSDIAALSIRAWAMYFDGSVCGDGSSIGILLVSPRGATYSFSIRLPTPCTNNLTKYEAVHKGMELLLEAGAEVVEVFGDSKLVISQLKETYRCESGLLFPLWRQCQELMVQFRYINFYWIPRVQNLEDNDLSQMASGYKDMTDGVDFPINLLDPARGAPKKIRYRAMKHVLIGDDLFYRTLEGLLLKCLGPIESNRLLH
jgi:ribonuclease HI